MAPIELLARSRGFGDRTALVDSDGSYSYRDLLTASRSVALGLLRAADVPDLRGATVAYLVPRQFAYVAVQWGIWRAGGVAVPLAPSHPERELAYVLDDSRPVLAVAHPSLADRLVPLAVDRGLELLLTTDLTDAGSSGSDLPPVESEADALMLYTSGTTGRPKGVVHTHRSLEAQLRTLTTAWEWSRDDRILLVLPLHHLHGIVNVLGCALWSGASCHVLPSFDPEETWKRIGAGSLSLFMAVPTIYHRLVEHWEARGPDVRRRWSEGARRLRLMVSGSAALPVPLLDRWREITGHTLLERYGMTETGMILSNPLHGERRPGHVGRPLPGVEVRLAPSDPPSSPPAAPEGGEPTEEGEVEVRGATLFDRYWRRPEATAEAFTEDGWFRTGDVARLEGDSYRLLGRRSVDILKTGGYKVSALEIESVLLEHAAVAESAVVGIPDAEWGQRVCAAVVPRAQDRAEGAPGPSSPPGPTELRRWMKERLAPYKVPTRFLVLEALPRNALGKVQKPEVARLFQAAEREDT